MRKTLCIILAGCVALSLVWGIISSRSGTHTTTDYAMNTVITITVKSPNAEKDVNAAIEEIKRIEALMSVARPTSDVGRINSAGAGQAVRVSDEVYSLLRLALEISRKTDGAFDISINPLSELWNINSPEPVVPSAEDIRAALDKVNYKNIELNPQDKTVTLTEEGMSISLGAIAKGYAADCVAKLLRDRGVREAIVDLGGNVYIVGKNKTVAIQSPFKDRGEYFTTCRVSDTSVVTSGAYERYFRSDEGELYHHILNPKTGYPSVSDLKSSTVICENSALADGLSTAFYILGKDRTTEFMSSFDGVEVILLTEDDEIVRLGN